jgi:hypothetical protein
MARRAVLAPLEQIGTILGDDQGRPFDRRIRVDDVAVRGPETAKPVGIGVRPMRRKRVTDAANRSKVAFAAPAGLERSAADRRAVGGQWLIRRSGAGGQRAVSQRFDLLDDV